ncbi:MAG TPA: Gfo/Idh/MocA family oxidoreductase [Candidatus Lokiarchaeia archaeon]|nr:Gfo/Idh/MocA family oxidoreductase [Candidatus Lokiarchaeia archaeon]
MPRNPMNLPSGALVEVEYQHMNALKIGILGTGFVQDFHMQAYREIPNAEIVAVGSFTEEKAVAFAQKWQIPSAFAGENAISQVCTLADVEAVDIGLPNDLHGPAIQLAAENGKHVICEKPLGRTATEARAALHAVEAGGVLHAYAENQVYFPLHAQVLGMLEHGVIGVPYMVRSREAHYGPHSGWFWDPARSGGGVALDMGCHSVEVARKVFQNDTPVEALMWADTLVHDTAAEDNCTILVKYAHKQLGQAENSWSAHGGLDLRTEIFGAGGAVFLDNTRETGIRVFSTGGLDYSVEKGESQKGWLYPVPNEFMAYGYYHELKYFVECFKAGTLPYENFADGVVVNAILDAAYKSVTTKQWEPV